MTDVRIRHEHEARAHHLGDVPLATDALEGVLATIRSWGITAHGYEIEPDLFGQFVIDDTGAYFEVVVTADGGESA
jgi:hypothetical protein